MESVFNFLLIAHISAGALSLILFWIPALAKKGGKLHIQTGKVYVIGMWIVLISAALMSGMRAGTGNYINAAFLGFLSLVTAHPLWYAISILKQKKHLKDQTLLIRRVLSIVTFISAVGLIIWSILLKMQGPASLLLIFGILGLTSIREAIQPFGKARESANWLFEHLSGMIITGIAAHTAFLAFGGARFLSEILAGPLMSIPWILPTVVGVIAINRMKKKMRLA